MATNKRIIDLSNYKSVLPYASEIFGIYQPLLGWKSKRIQERFYPNQAKAENEIFEKVVEQLVIPQANNDAGNAMLSRPRISIAQPVVRKSKSLMLTVLNQMITEGASFEEATNEGGLKKATEAANLLFDSKQNELASDVAIRIEQEQDRLRKNFEEQTKNVQDEELMVLAKEDLEHQISLVPEKIGKDFLAKYIQAESLIAGALLVMNKNKQFDIIKKLLTADGFDNFKEIFDKPDNDAWLDGLNTSDKAQIDNVGLSPIGVVHLFRQYFFEFDSFLGTPVGHVWLSPGSSVELIETSTRRSLVERTSENSFESIQRSEKSLTEQDEISDAIKEENQQNLKLGASGTVNQGWVTGSATGTTSINYEDTQKEARELSHKHMKQQSEKISSEIKKNYKSTFKIITEITDTSSKRYVLNNSTDKLINYEMRRKMRQVGVQVQDIGTYLCWQTFVDNPGADLGVAELIHIAKPADIDPNKKFQTLEKLQPFGSDMNVTIPYIQRSKARGDLDESYGSDGNEIDREKVNEGELERIEVHFTESVVCPKSNYVLKNVIFEYQGNAVELKLDGIDQVGNKFSYSIQHINFGGQESMTVKAKLQWEPTEEVNAQIDAENKKAETLVEAEKTAQQKLAFQNAIKDRVTACSKINSRKFESLREEERIVIYRNLIDELLPEYYKTTDNHTRHKLSELLNAIFDIDKMLYFVAPEYWRPRLHQSHQTLGKEPKTTTNKNTSQVSAMPSEAHSFANQSIQRSLNLAVSSGIKYFSPAKTRASVENVSQWGGQGRKDNYYITEDSQPAKLGSSLGWLLQLDGDERRNAFLNAPWVKAVIPVRPGKEIAAVNWLQNIEGKQIDFDIEQLFELAKRVEKKHKDAVIATEKAPEEAIEDAPIRGDKITATPVDKVYEFGFYPLQGGFKAQPENDFEIIDQWTEIVPTDQIVPVEVKYDPKTGSQI